MLKRLLGKIIVDSIVNAGVLEKLVNIVVKICKERLLMEKWLRPTGVSRPTGACEQREHFSFADIVYTVE